MPRDTSHLIRGYWKKGQSGNPKGRPKKADCLIDCIKSELSQFTANGITTKEQFVAQALTDKAMMGDLKAIQLLLEFTVMRPAQAVNLGGGDGGPVVIRVIEDGK